MDDNETPEPRYGFNTTPRPWALNWPPYGQRTPGKHPGGYNGEPTDEPFSVPMAVPYPVDSR
jgi:hypothetical protein